MLCPSDIPMEQRSRVCAGWSSFRIPFHFFGQFEHVSLFDANIRFVNEAPPPPPPLDRPLFTPLLSNIRCDLITKQIIESMQRGEEGDKSSGIIFRGGEIIYKQYHKRLGVRTIMFHLTLAVLYMSQHAEGCRIMAGLIVSHLSLHLLH